MERKTFAEQHPKPKLTANAFVDLVGLALAAIAALAIWWFYPGGFPALGRYLGGFVVTQSKDASPSGAQEACSPSDIQILQADHRPTDGLFAQVVGELVNNCDEATGVVLRVTLRDQDGKVIISQRFWPASIANIPCQ